MGQFRHIAVLEVPVPVRSAGNVVSNRPISFDIFKDGVLYKAVPNCSAEIKRLAMLKDEVVFHFQPGKAVAEGGINDGNQHIAERIGEELRKAGLGG